MEAWDDIKPIEEYDTDWASFEKKNLVSNIFDGFFGWVNDSIEGRFSTLDSQRKKMLLENPALKITNLNDGYQLEVDRLNAIQQQASKGFQIIDINPGLLDPLENTLNLDFEFLFSGTNFLPSQNNSIAENFRSVNVPIAGTFLKIEFIQEYNSTSNLHDFGTFGGNAVAGPYAPIKYQQALKGPFEVSLATGQTTYSFDNFARNKVYLDFGSGSGTPHLIPTSGRIFKTYFNEFNIHLNIGAPKIRITVGFNSEVIESDSNAAVINSRLSLTGSGRLMSDVDTVMSPFCLTENDINTSTFQPQGLFVNPGSTGLTTITFPLVVGGGFFFSQVGASYNSMGYTVLWINRLYFQANMSTNLTFIRVYLYTGVINPKRVHTFKLQSTTAGTSVGQEKYCFEPCEPIRVVIPSADSLFMDLNYSASAVPGASFYLTYQIDGYSYGEILRKPNANPAVRPFVYSSKWITDSTFISDYNRIECLKEG